MPKGIKDIARGELNSYRIASMDSVTFATYNILNPYHAVKWADIEGLNEKGRLKSVRKLRASSSSSNAWRVFSNWEERKKKLMANLALADITCIQEISRETIGSLVPEGYAIAVAAYHRSDHKWREYGNAIVFRQHAVFPVDAFELRWIQDKSDRASACAVFLIGNYKVLVLSIHLTGYDPEENDSERKQEAKKRGFQELVSYVEQTRDFENEVDAIIIAGDLNEDPREEKHSLYRAGYLLENGFYYDGSLVATEPSKKRKIDWLFYKPLNKELPLTLEPLNLERKQIQASDHLMSGSKLILNRFD